MAKMGSAFAQTSVAPGMLLPNTNRLVLPLTNGLGFTNTLVHATNLSALQLSNVVDLLLSLQTNIEEVLPVLTTLTSNATFETAAGQVPQTVPPLTSSPAGASLPPTGRVTNPIPEQTIAMPLGSNIIEIDPATFQGLVSLRDDLELALPVLQMLNGTAPSQTNNNTNTLLTPTGFTNPFPAVTNFPITPITHPFSAPLTNQSHILTIPSPF